MNTRGILKFSILACLTLLWSAAPPAQAALDVRLGAEVQIGEDSDVFVAVSARYYDQDPRAVHGWNEQCRTPDDLAVALFLSRHSRKSPTYLLTLHAEGASWWDISIGLNVQPGVWFMPVQRDPGPPYGKAYGHWKKSKKSAQPIVLSDADCRNLVAVRLLHEYYGVSVEVAMEWRSSGKDLEHLTANEYRNRHGKSNKSNKTVASNEGSGKSNGKGKGKK